MTTARRGTSHGGGVQDVLLLHPDTLDAHPCRVAVGRRGLVLRRLPDRPSRTGGPGRAVRVPWWTVHGFSADEVEPGPEGTLRQVVEVVTDAGTLTLLVPAPEVSVLLSRVAHRSGRWHRARRPAVAAVARAAATVAGGLRPLARPVAGVAGTLWRAGVSVMLVVALLLRPVGRAVAAPFRLMGRLLARIVAALLRPFRPVGRLVAGSVVGLAVSAAWRSTRRASARRLGGGPGNPDRRLRPALAAALSVVLLGATGFVATGGGGAPASGLNRPAAHGATPAGLGTSGMARVLRQEVAAQRKPLDLPKATAPPAPAPPSLADQPPLSPHEVFGFAPYWTLTQGTGFDVGGLTTIAYFSIGVNADGSLDESGSGWDGYQSQDLANLVTRAHAAGVRVVLTVNCFGQSTLDQLTSSPTAPATLSAALVQAIEAKNLDGVNLDFEGDGSADQAGLTNLVTQVSAAVHAANPHYQVTMDTYASSAGDPGGFYDIPALAPAVDGFFVMSYQLNLEGSATAVSPLTSTMFSDLSTAQQYAAAVPASKVIMGTPYYGYSWPTGNGTMAAQATGPATPVSDAQVMAGGYPSYWDPVTDTAWTSYQVGGQWYEDYYEDPSSLYMIAQMAQSFGLGGVGIWALGMDGNDPEMLAALDGFAPPAKGTLAGPTATSPSGPGAGTGGGSTTTTGPGGTSTTTTQPATGIGAPSGSPSAPGAAPSTTAPASGSSPSSTTSTTTGPGGGSVTTTTGPPAGGGSGGTGTGGSGGGTGGSGGSGSGGTGTGTGGTTALQYSGTWKGQAVTLTLVATPTAPLPTTGTPVYLGQLTSFTTNDPRYTCLEASTQQLDVWELGTAPTRYIVRAQKVTGSPDCATVELTFPVPQPAGSEATGPGSNVTPATPPAPVTSPPPTTASTTTTTSPSDTTDAPATTSPPTTSATPATTGSDPPSATGT